MTTQRSRFGSIVCIVALVAALSPVVLAADDDEREPFHFRFELFDFEALFTDVDTNSSKFEEYRDMDTGPIVRRLHLFGESGDKNRTFDFDILNAGRADGRYTMRYGNSGRYSVLLDYNVIPHRFGNDGTILHSTRSGPGVYTISDATQQLLQDNLDAFLAGGGSIDFMFLADQLQPFIDASNIVSPGLERERARALVELGSLRKLAWKIDVRQETRDGSRPYGATFGFGNAIELPEPVRYDTKTAEVAGEWTGDRAGVRFGFNVSHFSNSVDTLTYDNPWRLTDSTDSRAYTAPGSASLGGPSTGRNALSPDNSAGQIFVAGHARFGKRGWLNGNLSFGRMEQDDPLLAHTVNTAIDPTVVDPTIRPPFDADDPANLPRRTADTEVDILHFTANAGTKFGDWGSLKVRARYYDYDNSSPAFVIPGYVRMDAVWEQIGRTTVPYGYTKGRIGAEFGWDPAPRTHFAIGYDLDTWDRDFREVDSSDEDILHMSFDSRSFKNLLISAAWEHGDRTADRYDPAAQTVTFTDPLEEVNNQFGLRKYDEGDREYDDARASVTWFATDAIDLTFGLTRRADDYPNMVLVPDAADPDPTRPTLALVPGEAMGLLSDEISQFNAELSYTPNEKFAFFVFGSRTDRETFQRARQSGGTLSMSPLDTWELRLDEVTDTWGVGLNGRCGSRWSYHLNGSLSDSDGDSDFFSPPGGTPDTAQGFDEYDDNKWLVYSAGFLFDVLENVQVGVTLAHDEFTTNRFSRNNLAPYLPGALILDLDDGDYDADLAMVRLRIWF